VNQTYLDTARLLTQVAPLVFVDDTFALKGGTAINLFVRDMPRLSVDLDLVFPWSPWINVISIQLSAGCTGAIGHGRVSGGTPHQMVRNSVVDSV